MTLSNYQADCEKKKNGPCTWPEKKKKWPLSITVDIPVSSHSLSVTTLLSLF